MQTVYVPVKVSERLPHYSEEVYVVGYKRMDKCFIHSYKKGVNDSLIGFFDDCDNLVTGYSQDHEELKKIHWLEKTESVFLTKEDTEKIKDLANSVLDHLTSHFREDIIKTPSINTLSVKASDVLTILNKNL